MPRKFASSKLFLLSMSLILAPALEAAPSVDGMVRIPAGEFWMGCGDEAPLLEDCRPRHRVYVDAFWMDQTPVTNQEFEAFAKSTSYITLAERPIDPKEVPGLSPQELTPGSIVFQMTKSPVQLTDHTRWWSFVRGANWRHPEGPASDIASLATHPVTHVAWEDADAYCRWRGSRLPTEAEYERAARGGLDRKAYAWGNEFRPGGKWMANTWQGHFPNENSRADGFSRTSPVKTYPPNAFDLYDVAGNVWEWTSDWYRPDEFKRLKKRAQLEQVVRNPQGPSESFDPEEPGVAKRVQKGGSFLCSKHFCQRYLVGSRGRAEPKSSASHTGFRCVRSFSATPAALFYTRVNKEAHEKVQHQSASRDVRLPHGSDGALPNANARSAGSPAATR